MARRTLEGISDRLRSLSQAGPLMVMRDALIPVTQPEMKKTVRGASVAEIVVDEQHPTFRQIFDMFEAGLHNRTHPDYVPFPSHHKAQARSNNRRASTGSTTTDGTDSLREMRLPPKIDFACVLRHVMVLNEFKDLISPAFASKPAPTSLNPTPSTRPLFLRMFQLKCILLSIMGDETSEEILPKLQALHDHFELDPADLKFILEHIALCQQQHTEIRWDLVQAMFFPEEEEVVVRKSVTADGVHEESISYIDCFSPAGTQASSSAAADASWRNFPDMPWPGSRNLNESTGTFPPDYDDEELSAREALQEVFLELFETSEESMVELSEADRQLRRRVLVELLQATNDEECHQSSMSLEDLMEIAYHVRICRKTNVPVEWDLICALVFPMNLEASSSSHAFSPFESSDLVEPRIPFHTHSLSDIGAPGRIKMQQHRQHREPHFGDASNRDDLQALFGLSNDELDLVLSHIRHYNGTDIRWDLIGKVLFPNDRNRQKLMAHVTCEM